MFSRRWSAIISQFKFRPSNMFKGNILMKPWNCIPSLLFLPHSPGSTYLNPLLHDWHFSFHSHFSAGWRALSTTGLLFWSHVHCDWCMALACRCAKQVSKPVSMSLTFGREILPFLPCVFSSMIMAIVASRPDQATHCFSSWWWLLKHPLIMQAGPSCYVNFKEIFWRVYILIRPRYAA